MSRAERNRAIADAYRAGELQRDIAARFGISKSNVSVILAKEGARLPKVEIYRKTGIIGARTARDPVIRARIAEGVRKAWARGDNLGRKAILADDPVKRADYLVLREAYGAQYAREAMGLAA